MRPTNIFLFFLVGGSCLTAQDQTRCSNAAAANPAALLRCAHEQLRSVERDQSLTRQKLAVQEQLKVQMSNPDIQFKKREADEALKAIETTFEVQAQREKIQLEIEGLQSSPEVKHQKQQFQQIHDLINSPELQGQKRRLQQVTESLIHKR